MFANVMAAHVSCLTFFDYKCRLKILTTNVVGGVL